MPNKLTKPLLRGLKDLSSAGNRFQPVELRASTTSAVAEELVAMGLAERGDCDPRFAEWGYTVGYRLTQAGVEARFYRRL